MVLSPRGILAIGLSLAGIAYFVIPSRIHAQQPQKSDAGIRATANGNGAATSAPPAPIPPVIGSIDLDIVLKNYEKVKASSKELSAVNQRAAGRADEARERVSPGRGNAAEAHSRDGGRQEA